MRLVAGGAPLLQGANMSERRQDFLARFDWIRASLCLEPRGHDMMSGGFLYPPTGTDTDLGLLFIETSGCLPMCGHGTIGLITFGLEHGLITPKIPGRLKVEVPAGIVDIEFGQTRDKVAWVRLRNVPAFVVAAGIHLEVPDFGPLDVDVAYGGNFYAIIEPQGRYRGLDDLSCGRLIGLSRTLRAMLNEVCRPVHPENETIRGVTHVLWADKPRGEADGRSAVFYGDGAIDRSPCGTGTSARMAHLLSKGKLAMGDRFVSESYIGSRFIGHIEALTDVAGHPAMIPSIEGSAHSTGFNTIWIDRSDPLWAGFSVT